MDDKPCGPERYRDARGSSILLIRIVGRSVGVARYDGRVVHLLALDRVLRAWIVGHRVGALDGVMWGLSAVGRGGLEWLLIAVALIAGRRLRLSALAPLLLALLLATVAADHVLKPLVDRQRPFVGAPQAAVIGGRPLDSSFPSGHASNALRRRVRAVAPRGGAGGCVVAVGVGDWLLARLRRRALPARRDRGRTSSASAAVRSPSRRASNRWAGSGQRAPAARSITIIVNDPGITPDEAAGSRPSVGSRRELRGHEEHAVRRRVESHVARARCRLQTVDDAIRVGAVLVDDGQRAVRVRRERVAGGRVVPAPSTPVPIGTVATTLPA